MLLRDQYVLKENFYLKKYLRENSHYYKNLNREPNFINKMNNLMKEEYKLTLPDKLDKLRNNISMFTTFMDIIN